MFLPATSSLRFPFYSFIPVMRYKRYVWLVIVILCAIGGAYGAQYVATAEPVAQHTQEVAAPKPPKPSAPVPTPSAPAPAPVVAPRPEVSAIPKCIPPKQGVLSQINLANQPAGLTSVTDAVINYRVYGDTPAQVKTQLLQCPAFVKGSQGFGAVTNSNVAWQYRITPNGAGACILTDVKVGLHTSTVLPTWQPTSSASNGLATQWQHLISHLEVHENGHTAIYQQQAKQLLNDLQSLSTPNCETMASAAEAKASAYINAMAAENSNYDVRTNHGVTQGAVLR